MTLLNPEGRIMIEGKVYEIDFENEEVRQIEVSGLKSAVSHTYNFDDEVLYMDNSLKSTATDYCPGYQDWDQHTTSYGSVETVLHYMQFGIYYRLKAEVKKSESNNYESEISVRDDLLWWTTKGSGIIPNGAAISGTDKSLVYAFYSGSRRLIKYTAKDIYLFWDDAYGGGLDVKSSTCH